MENIEDIAPKYQRYRRLNVSATMDRDLLERAREYCNSSVSAEGKRMPLSRLVEAAVAEFLNKHA